MRIALMLNLAIMTRTEVAINERQQQHIIPLSLSVAHTKSLKSFDC